MAHPHSLADFRGGARDARPPWGSKFFHFHAVFGKNLKNNSNFGSWRTPLSGGSRISPRRGRQLPGGGANIQFHQNFPKTAWNWKNLDPQEGGARPKFYYVDPPLPLGKILDPPLPLKTGFDIFLSCPLLSVSVILRNLTLSNTFFVCLKI